MSIVRRLLSLPFNWPRAGIAVLLPLLWLGWFFWPPRPDFSIEKPAGAVGVISADGSRVVFLPNQTELTRPDNDLKTYRFTALDVHSLEACKTTVPAMAIPFLLSPDGSGIAVMQPEMQWKVFSLVSKDEPRSLPTGDWSRVRWSLDGRFVVATDDAATVVVQASDGRVVFETRKAGEVAEVLPDGSGMFAVSREGPWIELWEFGTGEVTERYPLNLPPTVNDRRSSLLRFDRESPVDRICVSKDGLRVAVLVHSESYTMPTAVREYRIMTWNRSTREGRELEIGEPPQYHSFNLELSDDGRLALLYAQNRIYRIGREDAQGFVAPASGKTLCTTWDLSQGERRPPMHILPIEMSMEWQGRAFLIDSGNEVRMLDSASGREISRIAGVHTGPFFRHFFSKDHAAFHGGGQFDWTWSRIPASVANLLRPGRGWDTKSIRLSDGAESRILFGHRLVGFDSAGQLWTETSDDDNRLFWERWSPERPQPWWLYAVTAAGVGYLIWPTLARLTSRWRQTRPAGIAA